MGAKLEALRRLADGMYHAGIVAALTSLERRDPELAEAEAEEWQRALEPDREPTHHWSLAKRPTSPAATPDQQTER